MKKATDKMNLYYLEPDIEMIASQYLLNLWRKQADFSKRPLIFLCIGSDRYTGDALGPLIGSFLEENTDSIVYGTLDKPVHAGNLADIILDIVQTFSWPLIIAVDACLGQNSEIGNIEIWEGTIEAGIAVGNKLPKTGDIAMIGVVNSASRIGYLELQSTSLSLVMKLVKVIGNVLQEFYRQTRLMLESIPPESFRK